MSEQFPAHKLIHEYDGAYKCLDCQAVWGAITGAPRDPPAECVRTETAGKPKRYDFDVQWGGYNDVKAAAIETDNGHWMECADHDRIVADLQSRIDALMLEYCPEDMTPEQVKTWGEHQKAVDGQRDNCACDGASDTGCENCWSEDELRKQYRQLERENTELRAINDGRLDQLAAWRAREYRVAYENVSQERDTLRTQLAQAQNEALERAAQECIAELNRENTSRSEVDAYDCAKAIRALKTTNR